MNNLYLTLIVITALLIPSMFMAGIIINSTPVLFGGTFTAMSLFGIVTSFDFESCPR